MDKEKLYVILNDGKIGYIEKFCECERCISRGEVEIGIFDLEGKCLTYILSNELESEIVYSSYNLKHLIEVSTFFNNLKTENNKNLVQLVTKQLIDKILNKGE